MSLMRKAFITFLKERAHAQCGGCGQNNWAIPPDEERGMLVHVRTTLPGHFREGYFPAFIVVCNHCGNMRLHSKTIIDLWADEQSPTQAPLEKETP